VVGRKVWWLFAPDCLEGVREEDGEEEDGELVFDVREVPGEGGGVKVVQQVSAARRSVGVGVGNQARMNGNDRAIERAKRGGGMECRGDAEGS
jgi:hypothetical protein